jgi:hypothetical protein
MMISTKSIASISSALVALFLAIIGAYLALDRKVVALASAALTTPQVEHLIDLKTADKLDEIIRRLQTLDVRMDRLQIDQQNSKVERKGSNQ